MPDTDEQLRRAAFAVRDMRQKLEAAEHKVHAPIAIVGMGCSFPSAPDLATYWQMLLGGVDAIREIPPSRWDADALYDPDPDAPGKASTRWGGLIDDVDRFDAGFFGISPREAVTIDPQQRLLLETSWRAMEDAAIPVETLAKGQTGVYVGISTNDYANILTAPGTGQPIDGHASLGNSVAVAAGRLAYTFGFVGPAMVVDTACSSSLVAVHLAIRALRLGEIDAALAAGVNLTLSPELTIGFSKARMMAADGRCKTFDARADGYVRGEGCGTLVLRRLVDAQRDGDRIHAILRGSAVNQDGHSNGLTAPNGPSQVAVIQAAARDARIDPSQIALFEAHGTGTALGDPIEAQALAQVIARAPNRDHKPYVASVKTNIGHLEAAAGMAGLIKTALSLQQKTVPPHLHFETLNPHIAASGFPFRIPLKPEPLSDVDGEFFAGVSSFGFSGTNAHVILEAAPDAALPAAQTGPALLALSAHDAPSLDRVIEDVSRRLSKPGANFHALAASLTAGRGVFRHRTAVAACDSASAADKLRMAVRRKAPENPQIGFLFTGQGSQYPGMARELMSDPVFAEVVARSDAALDGLVGELLSSGTLPDGRTDLVQPLLVTLEYAVAEVWRARGITPAAVIGHSVGEVAAAAFIGAIDFEEALRFVAERGRLMETTAGQGSMAAALGTAEEVTEAIRGTGAVVAAYNAPSNTVLSGTHEALAAAVATLEKRGLTCVPLQVATAFHSPVLNPVLDSIERAAADMTPGTAHVPMYSNLDGAARTHFDAAYWKSQAAAPVSFQSGLKGLAAKGCNVFLEVGPQPVLSGFGRQLLPEAHFIPSLRRGQDAALTMADASASMFTAGAPLDLSAVAPPRHVVDAPGHPFQRERYWPATESTAATAPGGPLLGALVETPYEPNIAARRISGDTLPFLRDHVVFGDIVVPGAMYAVMGTALSGRNSGRVEDLLFEAPMSVPKAGLNAQVLNWSDGRFEIHARGDNDDQWTRHVAGQWGAPDAHNTPALELSALETAMTEDTDGLTAFFAQLRDGGIDLGPSFCGITRLWRGAGQALAEIAQPTGWAELGVAIHPASLDSCFQTLGATFQGEGDGRGYLPLSLDSFEIWAPAPDRFRCHATVSSAPGSPVAVGNFTLCSLSGDVFAQVKGLQIKEVAPPDPIADMFVGVDWIPVAHPEMGWSDPDAIDAALAASSTARGTLPETGLAEALDALAASHAKNALSVLTDFAPRTPFETRLFARIKSLAAKAQVANADIHAAFPDNTGEIGLVDRCGQALESVLRGRTDPLEAMFQERDTADDAIYAREGLAERANALVADAIAEAQRRRGTNALSILEVGAGTGATTEAILSALPEGTELRYSFTDISDGFLNQARARFGDREGLTFARLDLEQPPESQGFDLHSFDIVIAANVVHATRAIAESLDHVHRLLRRDGLLMMIESTKPQDWWDIVFGLTSGWWRFEDTDLRPDHALLGQKQWHKVLVEHGFAAPHSVPVDTKARQSIVMAKAAETRPLLVVHPDDAAPGLAQEFLHHAQSQSASRSLEAVAISGAESAIAGYPGAEIVFTGGLSQDHRAALKDALLLSQWAARGDAGSLSILTQGAFHADRNAPAGAALAGFARVLNLEHPELGARLVDFDDKTKADTLLTALAIPHTGAQQLSLLDGAVFTSRLMPRAVADSGAPEFDPDGTYLITGAFGGLGPHLAKWLAKHGAGRLVLTGRNLPGEPQADALKILGPNVDLLCLDTCDADAIASVIDHCGPNLKGVFHLAGQVADGAILGQTWDDFSAILPAKADGALALERLCATLPLDHFVMFSTSAALIGNPGQSNHAAANSVLDAVARRRKQATGVGLSINWGAFAEAGAVTEGDRAEVMLGQGVRLISIKDGLAALGRALRSDQSNLGVISLDWPTFLSGADTARPDFLEHFYPKTAVQPRQSSPSAPTVDFRAELAGLTSDDLHARLTTLIAEEAASVLGLKDANTLDPDQPLSELGLDSLLALDLRTRLGDATGEKQSATLLFDHPSVGALTEVFAELFDQQGTPVPAPEQPVPKIESPTDQIARQAIEAMTEAELEALVDAEFALTSQT